MSETAFVQQAESLGSDLFMPLVHNLNEFARTRVMELLRRNTRTYQPGTDIVVEGGKTSLLYWVLEGWVALNKSLEDGHVQTIDIILPSDVIQPASGGASTSVYDVHALTETTVFSISNSQLDDLVVADPLHICASLRARAAAARARNAERMLRLGQASALVRVAYVLLELLARLEMNGGGGKTDFHLPLTQQQIGDFAGLSSVHICRTMRRLSRHGLIATSGHDKISIKDAEALSKIANIDLARLKKEILPFAA